MLSKITQSYHANKSRSSDLVYKVGDKVMLSTLNRRRDYKTSGERRVAKFMPRFDGPYLVIATFPEASTVTLDIPNAPNLFPTFHTRHVKPHKENDNSKFPSRSLERPGAITVDGMPEFLVEKILDHKTLGRGLYKFLVRFSGYGPEDDTWITGRDLDDNEALDDYLATHPQVVM
jgi:Chromo (CHRromatin Organisation MOdifier) domain